MVLVGQEARAWRPAPAYRYPFTPYPTGWFAAAWGPDLEPGGVVAERLFGRDVVVFRGESGGVAVLDAHCPHLGAHLGEGGTVDGDCIRCPFHGWTFGSDGVLDAVPFLDGQRPRAATGSWPVREVDGMVLVWHDAAGGPPTWEPEPVGTEGLPAHVLPDECVWLLRTHCQEIVENGVDVSHFPDVHGTPTPAEQPTPEFGEHDYVVELRNTQVVGESALASMITVRAFGVGIQHVTSGIVGSGVRTQVLIHAASVDEHHVRVRAPITAGGLGSDDADASLLDTWRRAFAENFERDARIWEHKAYRATPRLSQADGPIMDLRRWASRFYAEGQPVTA